MLTPDFKKIQSIGNEPELFQYWEKEDDVFWSDFQRAEGETLDKDIMIGATTDTRRRREWTQHKEERTEMKVTSDSRKNKRQRTPKTWHIMRTILLQRMIWQGIVYTVFL